MGVVGGEGGRGGKGGSQQHFSDAVGYLVSQVKITSTIKGEAGRCLWIGKGHREWHKSV